MPMIAFAPCSAPCASISLNASARAFSHNSVYSVMLPPTRLCSAAPILPTMLRERTTLLCSLLWLCTMRCPGSSSTVVPIAVETAAIGTPLWGGPVQRRGGCLGEHEIDAHVDAPLG